MSFHCHCHCHCHEFTDWLRSGVHAMSTFINICLSFTPTSLLYILNAEYRIFIVNRNPSIDRWYSRTTKLLPYMTRLSILWEYISYTKHYTITSIYGTYEDIHTIYTASHATHIIKFLAATQPLYECYFLSVHPSVRPSVCPSVRLAGWLSVCHTFLTMFPSSYHHEIFRSYHQGPG